MLEREFIWSVKHRNDPIEKFFDEAHLSCGEFEESKWSHSAEVFCSALSYANDVFGWHGATFAGPLRRCDKVANSFDQFVCCVGVNEASPSMGQTQA